MVTDRHDAVAVSWTGCGLSPVGPLALVCCRAGLLEFAFLTHSPFLLAAFLAAPAARALRRGLLLVPACMICGAVVAVSSSSPSPLPLRLGWAGADGDWGGLPSRAQRGHCGASVEHPPPGGPHLHVDQDVGRRGDAEADWVRLRHPEGPAVIFFWGGGRGGLAGARPCLDRATGRGCRHCSRCSGCWAVCLSAGLLLVWSVAGACVFSWCPNLWFGSPSWVVVALC